MQPSRRVSTAASVLAAVTSATSLAAADAPPKVCVAIAGDADEAARTSARALETAIASRTDLRAVADDTARAALRGEPGAESTQAELATARRSLDGTDRDAQALDLVGERLACALVVEISPRPADTSLRAYDVVHHAFRGRMSVGAVDASLIDRFVLEPARASLEPVPPALPASPAAVRVARPVVAPSAAITARTPAADTRAVVAHNATPVPASAAHRSPVPAWLPWVIVGAAAAALVTVIVVTENTGPAIPVIHVDHPAAASASP